MVQELGRTSGRGRAPKGPANVASFPTPSLYPWLSLPASGPLPTQVLWQCKGAKNGTARRTRRSGRSGHRNEYTHDSPLRNRPFLMLKEQGQSCSEILRQEAAPQCTKQHQAHRTSRRPLNNFQAGMKEGPGARRGRQWATQPALRPQGKEALLSRTAVAPAVCVLCPLAQNQKSPTRLLPRLSVCRSGCAGGPTCETGSPGCVSYTVIYHRTKCLKLNTTPRLSQRQR
jgi:hypothetical protein